MKQYKNSIKQRKNSINQCKNSIKQYKNSIKQYKNSMKTHHRDVRVIVTGISAPIYPTRAVATRGKSDECC